MGVRTLCLLQALLFIVPSTPVLKGPEAVRDLEGATVSVTCSYEPGWEAYYKYWCQGADWITCRIIVRTSGSEQEVKNGRVSIRDNHTARAFTVTMKELKREDADTYWCGVVKPFSDLGHNVQVTVDPGMNMKSGIPEEGSPNTTSVRFRSSSPLLFLIFLKSPLLLITLGVLLWVKRPLWGPKVTPVQPAQRSTPIQSISHTVGDLPSAAHSEARRHF